MAGADLRAALVASCLRGALQEQDEDYEDEEEGGGVWLVLGWLGKGEMEGHQLTTREAGLRKQPAARCGSALLL